MRVWILANADINIGEKKIFILLKFKNFAVSVIS